jgi:predicted flap endonuclease-1-like 5' DNA nuclease
MRVLFYFVLGYVAGSWVRQTARQDESPDLALSAGRLMSAQTVDPLIELTGIGPVFEQALNTLGIWTFSDLAREDADALAERLGGRISAERIRRERWIEQARERAGR